MNTDIEIQHKRHSIPAHVRRAVLSRDGYRCHYCGATGVGIQFHFDHVKPVSRGGDNEIDNIVVACQDCNLSKRARWDAVSDKSTTPLKMRYLRTEVRRLSDVISIKDHELLSMQSSHRGSVAKLNEQIDDLSIALATAQYECDTMSQRITFERIRANQAHSRLAYLNERITYLECLNCDLRVQIQVLDRHAGASPVSVIAHVASRVTRVVNRVNQWLFNSKKTSTYFTATTANAIDNVE